MFLGPHPRSPTHAETEIFVTPLRVFIPIDRGECWRAICLR